MPQLTYGNPQLSAAATPLLIRAKTPESIAVRGSDVQRAIRLSKCFAGTIEM
jgi:hypothetical protein